MRRALEGRAGYAAFQRHVEPEIASSTRLHRFAAVPESGFRATPAAALAVVIDPSGGGDGEATQASLRGQTVRCAHTAEYPILRALQESRAPWIALIRSGDRLAPIALERLGQAATLASDAAVITCDDDIIDRKGRRSRPMLRPGPCPDLWLERNPDFALVVVAREAALAAAGAGGEGWSLFSCLAGRDGSGHVHVPLVLCHRAGSRRGGSHPRSRQRPVRHPPDREPSVEVIVAFRDRPQLLERCVRSVLERSTYERLRLRLVDNGSTDPGLAPLLERLEKDSRVSVEADGRPFHFSALMNGAAARAKGDLLVFLNNDTEAISRGWIEELLGEALRPEVGAVAPMLLYPDGRVQHAGVAIGIHGWAGHPFAGLRPDERTPFGAAGDGTRNWMAVSAACMMVEKSKFDEVGGFDESFAVGGGDVDLCLRLTAAGYRSLCVPHARLIHDESASRDPSRVPAGDIKASRRSYGAFRTVGDPFYHPALTFQDTTCRLRSAGEPAPPP